jgi:hypothetical protein
MNTVKTLLTKTTRTVRTHGWTRPPGWYVVRAGSNGRIRGWIAGPFVDLDAVPSFWRNVLTA